MQKKQTLILAFIAFLFTASWVNAQNVSINETGATPDNSAMLDITSSNKGLLIPRMDSTTRKNIMNPAEGLMVFDSTYNSFWYYNGTAWDSIGGGGSSDNLGNHIASQNLQLNDNWLNNDGGANEGIYIDANGQVGFGTIPSAAFHVSMGSNLELNAGNTIIDFTYSGDICQSFTPTKTGELHSFQLQTSGTTAVTYNLYEGHGTGGALLAGPLSQANPQAAYLFSGITLTQGQVYTLEVVNPSGNSYTLDTFGNRYPGGEACHQSQADFWFLIYMVIDNPGVRIDDTQIQLNEYNLPITDGTSGQNLQTDGAGNVSWTSPATDMDNQDLSLSGTILSLSNDATPVNLSGLLSNTDHQDLSLSGNTLSLTNDATTVDLGTYLDNTDAQDMSLSGNILSLSNDATAVNLSPFLDNTDAQDMDLSGNTLSLTNDATTVDLSPYLDNTDAQDLSLSGNTLSLSNDATTVDLSSYLDADNLGNHSASQNLQLNGNWINNDGGATEGLNIDNSGQVGINTVPAASFHVNMGGPTTSNVLTIPNNGTTLSTAFEYQSFTAPANGDLNSITIFLANIGGSTTYRLISGEGTSGTILYESTLICVAGNNAFNVSGVTLVKNQVYTIVFFPPIAQPHTFYYDNTNPYSGGISRANVGWDLAITLNMTVGNMGFQVSNSGVTINEYTLPDNDGNANQILTTDGAGNVSWSPSAAADNLGNHAAGQNILLNGNWLSNDGGNEGITVNNNGEVGIGRSVGALGSALVELYGPALSGDGPHMQAVVSGSDHPVTQHFNFDHDNVAILFDAYYDPIIPAWKSSDAGSNFAIYKTVDKFINFYSGNNAIGGNLVWNTGTFMDTLGNFAIGRDLALALTNKLEVEGNASKTTAGSWLANSDARLKKNIRPLSSEEMLEKILALQGVTYEWNDDKTGTKRPEGFHYGFTAQNIQEIFPSLVTEDKQGFLQTPYGTYDAMTVEAIRALNDKIEKLAAENAKLRTQSSELAQLKEDMQSIKALLQHRGETQSEGQHTEK